MTNALLELFKTKNLELQEYQINDHWHSLIKQNKIPISAGFSANKLIARQIAFFEYLERCKIKEFQQSTKEIKNEWQLDTFKTGCGFAAGATSITSQTRSLLEATERWTLSKWEDENLYIPQVELPGNLDIASNWYIQQFNKVIPLQKEICLYFNNQYFKVYINAILAFKENGVFVGYSAGFNKNSGWQHCFVEAFRNYRISKNPENNKDLFPYNRIFYFSNNSEIALNKLEQKEIGKVWPIPVVNFQKTEHFNNENFYLTRTILAGLISWEKGSKERFLL